MKNNRQKYWIFPLFFLQPVWYRRIFASKESSLHDTEKTFIDVYTDQL